jgi:putative flippase GtrA
MKSENKRKEEIIKLIKFGIVGVSNTVVYYLVNIAVVTLLKNSHINWDYYAANILSFVISVLWSFYWNNKAVFKLKNNEQRSIWKSLLKTYLAYGFTGIILNNILSWIWIDVLNVSQWLTPLIGKVDDTNTLSKYIAPLLNSIIGIPVNYILNRFWAFKSTTKNSNHDSVDTEFKNDI